MYVTPETFGRHLQWLRECLQPVRLSDWLERVRAGQPVPANACAITFDDGWRDNYEYALPLLRQTETPATLFAVSHLIGTDGLFWPNRLSRLLDAHGPAAGSDPAFAWLRELAAGLPGGIDAALQSADARAELIKRCKSLSDAELKGYLDAAEAAWPVPAPEQPALMDWEQLRAMADSGLVEIGSHTCHHYRLNAALHPDIVSAEIRASRLRLEQELGRSVPLFCYPNGDYTDAAAGLVAQHYEAAVTTQRGINMADTPRNKLVRIGMHDDVSASYHGFMARLSGWI